MCSILGIIAPEIISEKLMRLAPELLKLTRDRGPDDSGCILLENRIFLGSNRLSIIGLAGDSKMPLKSSNGDYWIVYNGELYNHIELRNELIENGFQFKSTTDTEVVLNAYIKWKEEFIEKLNGIFAFLIFDKKNNRVISARDRFGCKPLYYCKLQNNLIFSSDFTILNNLLYPKSSTIDPSALTAYMQCRFVPGDRTISKDIHKLQPAELQVWDMENKMLNCKSKLFWQPKFSPRPFNQTEFTDNLFQAFKYTKTADVSPSILLSGGLDSAAIAAALNYQGDKNIKTYTCAFTNPDSIAESHKPSYQITTPNIDERIYAKLVSDKFNFSNQSFLVDANVSLDLFLSMQKALGEPIASTNALGHYLLARELKGLTKLAITGTGSDELLGGYKELYFKNNDLNLHTIDDFSVFLKAFGNLDMGIANPLEYLNPDIIEKDYLYSYASKSMKLFPSKYSDELLNQLAFFEIAFALPGWELDQADRLFMSQSIELRPAFLENKFVDYALTIPSRMKLNKIPLKRAMQKFLPENIIERPKYPGLGTPKSVYDHMWFKEAIGLLFNNPSDIWNKKKIAALKKQPQEKWNFDVLYRMLYLQVWLSRHK